MQSFFSTLVFVLLIILLLGLVFLPIILLSLLDQPRKRKKLAFLIPLLQQNGFRQIPPLLSVWQRSLALYQSRDGRISVSLLGTLYGQGSQTADFVRFGISIPHIPRFLICSPSLAEYTGDILYEIYWKRVSLDALSPLGLLVYADRSNADRLNRHFARPEVMTLFQPLAQSRQTFYLLSESPDYLTAAFAIQPPESQRAALWLAFVQQFCEKMTTGSPPPP